MKNTVFIIVICLLTSFCKAQQHGEKSTSEVAEFSVIWKQFVATLVSKDKVKFMELSGVTIRCYDCLENTDEEQKEMNRLRDNDPNWYERIYNDLVYIPITVFIEEDYDLIFTSEFIKILEEKNPFVIKNTTGDDLKYEVLVTTIEPTNDFEGMQHAFEFTKFEGVWRFNQLSTIP